MAARKTIKILALNEETGAPHSECSLALRLCKDDYDAARRYIGRLGTSGEDGGAVMLLLERVEALERKVGPRP